MSLVSDTGTELRNKAVQWLVNLSVKRRRGGGNQERVKKLCYEFSVEPPKREINESEIINGYDELCSSVLTEPLGEMDVSKLLLLAEMTAIVSVGRDLKTNQIRRFLDGVNACLRLLSSRPLLFSTSRSRIAENTLGLRRWPPTNLLGICNTCMKAIDQIRPSGEEGFSDWQRFERFVEAIVAYHKFYKEGTDMAQGRSMVECFSEEKSNVSLMHIGVETKATEIGGMDTCSQICYTRALHPRQLP